MTFGPVGVNVVSPIRVSPIHTQGLTCRSLDSKIGCLVTKVLDSSLVGKDTGDFHLE